MRKALVFVVLACSVAMASAPATVYVTKTGEKYHNRRNCRGLARAKEVYSMSEADAKAKGYGGCKICVL